MRKIIYIVFLLVNVCFVNAQKFVSDNLSDEQILELINMHRPSKGGEIPSDLKYRLGATHVNGQYHLTDEPFIIEGAKKVQELGYGIQQRGQLIKPFSALVFEIEILDILKK